MTWMAQPQYSVEETILPACSARAITHFRLPWPVSLHQWMDTFSGGPGPPCNYRLQFGSHTLGEGSDSVNVSALIGTRLHISPCTSHDTTDHTHTHTHVPNCTYWALYVNHVFCIFICLEFGGITPPPALPWMPLPLCLHHGLCSPSGPITDFVCPLLHWRLGSASILSKGHHSSSMLCCGYHSFLTSLASEPPSPPFTWWPKTPLWL